MAKYTKRSLKAQPKKKSNISLLIFQGVILSLISTLCFILFLSLANLMTESTFMDDYMQYIMVAITLVSIFIGSVFTTNKYESKGLLIGMSIGIIYVLISISLGLEFGEEQLSTMILINKFVAGMLAGCLGGFIGVNL